MRRRISEDIFVLYPNRDVRYHIIYCTWNCWHYNLQPDPTQFLMYVSLVHPLARRKKKFLWAIGHVGPTCSPLPFSIRWTSMETLHLWHWKKRERRKVVAVCLASFFCGWFLDIFGAAGCCLCYISGQPTDMFPWDPKKSVWISWTFPISTLSKVPGRYD